MMEKILCFNCKWYVAALACPAFPAGIPEEIMAGSNDHSEVQPGQAGNFVFTDKTKTEDNAGVRS